MRVVNRTLWKSSNKSLKKGKRKEFRVPMTWNHFYFIWVISMSYYQEEHNGIANENVEVLKFCIRHLTKLDISIGFQSLDTGFMSDISDALDMSGSLSGSRGLATGVWSNISDPRWIYLMSVRYIWHPEHVRSWVGFQSCVSHVQSDIWDLSVLSWIFGRVGFRTI
jgi:hypothetical protein